MGACHYQDLEYLASDDDTPNLLDPGLFQNLGTLFDGRAGGGDVINEPDVFTNEDPGDLGRHRKSPAKILEAFTATFGFHLWLGEANALETGSINWDAKSWRQALGEFSREEFGLIKSTVTEATWVEWYRNDEVRQWESMMSEAFFEEINQGDDGSF